MAIQIQNITDWRQEDPAPDTPLSAIFPVSVRAENLLSRQHAHRLLETNYLNLAGAVEMMRGLDYHHSRFMEIIEVLSSIPWLDSRERPHKEALLLSSP
jgi:hypothetical protein